MDDGADTSRHHRPIKVVHCVTNYGLEYQICSCFRPQFIDYMYEKQLKVGPIVCQKYS